jgi:hypothetical protein
MRKDWPRLRDVAKIYVGEVFDNAPNKKYLSNEPIGPLVCRGANIDRYLFREESTQGDSRYLKEMLFKKEKQKSIKLDLMNKARIALQRGAAVDNWRRLIASLIPPGYFCFDTVLLIVPERIDIKVLLALINSDLWEWRFRCTSATNHVNEYDVEEMVIPPCLLNQRSKEHETLKSLVEKILKDPYQFARRSEQQMLPPNSDDFQIDDLIFEIYGLNQGEIALMGSIDIIIRDVPI